MSERVLKPFGSVGLLQPFPGPVAGICEQRLQGNEAVAKAQPNAEAHAGLVRPAENPGVIARQGVRPQRTLAHIESDVGRPERHDRALRVGHRVHRAQTAREIGRINQRFGPAALESGLDRRFQDQDSPQKQYDEAGLNAPNIVDTVLKALRHNSVGVVNDGVA